MIPRRSDGTIPITRLPGNLKTGKFLNKNNLATKKNRLSIRYHKQTNPKTFDRDLGKVKVVSKRLEVKV
jgi:hypothetical protein